MIRRIGGLLLALVLLAGLCAAPAKAENTENMWETVLLLGTDTRRDEGAQGRADAIMLCAVHRESGAIRLISLARDMWIQLPGSSAHNKINAAYRFGGAQMMMEAVGGVLGLEIERYAAVNFYGFCDLIDTLDGVTVELQKGEASAINKRVNNEHSDIPTQRLKNETGEVTLSGVQALAYARIRNLDNDFGRTGRQRKVLTAVMQKVAQMNPVQQLDFAAKCLECVETNMSLTQMLALGATVLAGGLDDFEQMVLPAVGNYRYDSADGVSKVIFDAEAVRADVQRFLGFQE